MQFYLDRLAQTDGVPAAQYVTLRDGQQLAVAKLLENVLTNVFYSMLLGLEGSASIGRVQPRYELLDPAGNSLNKGDLGGHAWQYFQNDGDEPE